MCSLYLTWKLQNPKTGNNATLLKNISRNHFFCLYKRTFYKLDTNIVFVTAGNIFLHIHSFWFELNQRYTRNYLAHKIKILLYVGRELHKYIKCIGRRLQYCPNKKQKIMAQETIQRAWKVFHESCLDPYQQTGKVHLHFES